MSHRYFKTRILNMLFNLSSSILKIEGDQQIIHKFATNSLSCGI